MMKFELRKWKDTRPHPVYFILRSMSVQKIPTIRLVASFSDVRGFFNQSSAEFTKYILDAGVSFDSSDYKASEFIASGETLSKLKYKIPWLMI